MSRIDEALRIWEGRATEAPPADAARSGEASPLNQYQREETERQDQDEPVLPPGSEPARQFRPAASARHASKQGVKLFSDADLRARLVTGMTNTASLEQYRRLAALLHEQQVESQLKTIMITSAVPHEGKTLTVVNLALTLTESYARRVLVIDADLRWPSLHTVLGIPNGRGLSEALRERHCELPFTEVSNRLSALTAGRPGPEPLAGLSSSRMGEVIDECASRFDWVLIDTSPVGVLPDAQVLTRLAGAVILVIGAGSTPAAVVKRTIDELGGPEAIIGTVLNRVDRHQIPESGYYAQYGAPYGKR